MNLYIDIDGTGTMVNDGAVPFTFDGYAIASDGGLLDPANIHGVCDPFNWILLGWPSPFPPFPQYCTWVKLSSTAHMYSEATMSLGLTLQPGASIVLGNGFLGGTQTDMTYTYVDSATAGSFEGAVIPEPATLALLGLGAVAAMRRRR